MSASIDVLFINYFIWQPETLTGNVTKGGEFLIRQTSCSDVFIPEEINEEQKMIVQMARDFVINEIYPAADRIEKQEDGIAVSLINKAGELGLLGTSIPEEYGGYGKDFVTGTLLAVATGDAGSIAVSMSAHMGIGTLPILYFGTEDQKKKYLPQLATGQLKAAYCLTEPVPALMHLRRKHRLFFLLTRNTIPSMARKCGSRMVGLQISSSYLRR
jgi:alkylation response protein AidB-like acyl-CoA dehydrogenase